MSIEPRKVWQVIRYVDNINGGEPATQQQPHVQTIAAPPLPLDSHHEEEEEDGYDEEEDEDSYNHLIEEDDEDIISYDSESSFSRPQSPTMLMDSSSVAGITRPMVLDLATGHTTTISSNNNNSHHHEPQQQHHLQVSSSSSPRLVYVKLGDASTAGDHVITVNRPMVEDHLSRMLSANTMVNMSNGGELHGTSNTAGAPTGATDEELTSLTWLQDKNLIQGINLTTSKSHPNGGVGGAPQTENAVTISPNCDKQKQIVTLNVGGTGGETTVYSPVDHQSSSIKTIAISELASKILCSSSLPPSISHLLPSAKGSPQPPTTPSATTQGALPNGQPPSTSTLQHVHKKYRREEHVKISKQQQLPQPPPAHQSQHHQLQLTPNHSSSSGHSPNGAMLSPYSERSIGGSRKYADESPGYHQQSPSHRNGGKQSGGGGGPGSASKQKHPVHVPYNPFVHTNSKPPLSFSSLIFMAIENATEKALPVKEIYAWIVKHFPYFKTAPTGWKNSVRHNLSLNKCFQKVEKAPNMGKGSLWKVEQQYRQVLMQALTRSPYHQFAGILDKAGNGGGGGGGGSQYSEDNSFDGRSDTNNNNQMLMCNSSPSSSTISSTSSSLSTSPTGMDPHHHHHHNSNSSSHNHHHQSSGMKMVNGRPFDPVLFPYLSKEISKLDTNNNAIYANNHYNLSCVDSESESTGGYYENSVDGDSTNGGYSNRFRGGYIDYSQYPYDGHVDNSTDNMDDVNAATAMLALKHGPKIFEGGIRNGHHPVITSSPSEDHTYSAGNENADGTTTTTTTAATGDKVNGNGVGSSNGVKNGAFAFGGAADERTHLDQSDIDYEEQRKKAEGVDALLNLAGFASNTSSQILMKRRASSDMMSCFSNESSMDYNSSAMLFSSPSPQKRSKTRYLQSAM